MMLMPFAPGALLLAVAFLQRAVPFSDLIKDAHAVAGVPFYVGLISNIGILLWGAAAAVCLFAGLILFRTREVEWGRFLLASGIFSTVLTLDDMFQLHEVVMPVYLGVPQKLVYVAYVLAALVYLFAFRKTILKTEFSLLAVALALFAVSVGLDGQSKPGMPLSWVPEVKAMEEAAKLMGILAWLTYFVRTCKGVIARLISSPTA
jgi:hypothetical protein